MASSNYNTITEDSPLMTSQRATSSSASSSAESTNEIPYAPSVSVVRTVFGADYENYTLTEKAASLITTSRRKRPVFSLFLGTIFAVLVVTLALCLLRGYDDYSHYRSAHDIPRRVNITAMVNGDYYSDYTTTTTTTYTTAAPTFTP
ncbi:hypothetical protein V1525DRAFT_456539 [Lipomyces kononenkoae]|uniref:Uncharacterized protein n=1 Tax=Lipomyces kononenkoae TaxID=34357 RepID=A0ACC3T172_LIPKO